MTKTLHDIYNDLCVSGKLRRDNAQLEVIDVLEHLRQQIIVDTEKNFFQKLFSRKRPRVKGIYIYGDVGRGKTILMDLFYNALPIQQKKRIHFHAFMQKIQQKLHQFGAHDLGKQPIESLAEAMAVESSVLCFDEFLVEHIGDAMILRRLFEELFKRGVLIVATSNVAPKDLYKGGFQYEQFAPFIPILEKSVNVLELCSAGDYRAPKMRLGISVSQEAQVVLENKYIQKTGGKKPILKKHILDGRTYYYAAYKTMLWITFAELCKRPHGARDYLALTHHFTEWFISDVPIMRDGPEAMRFKTLVDVLYDKGTQVYMSTESAPEFLIDGCPKKYKRTISRLIEILGKG